MEPLTRLSVFSFWAGVSSKQEVKRSPEALTIREQDSVVLNCSYTDGTLYSLQWFRQDPGKGLTLLMIILSNQKEQTSGRIKVLLDTPARQSSLYIVASQPSDSATYLCAVRHSAQQAPATSTQTLQLGLQPHVLS
uniref:Ig-like domain-containing protein n=1 Tax=Neovison vison TaxID=452646 RepID=A0A8C7BRP9_NEOVI